MSNHSLPSGSMRKSERLVVFAYYLMVAGMLTCIAAAAVQVGERVMTGWRGEYLVAFGAVVAIESMFSARRLRKGSRFTTRAFLYRLAEFITLLVVLKLLQYLQSGGTALLGDLPRWRVDFLQSFFTPGYLMAIFLTLLVWGLALEFEDLLYPFEVNESTIEIERSSGFGVERMHIRGRLVEVILLLGGLLLLLTTLLYLDQGAPGGLRIASSTLLVLTYFGLALALLSLTQLSSLRIRWGLDEISVSPGLIQRWLIYGATFLGALAILALLLPTHYAVGALAILSLLLSTLVYILGLLIFLITLPFIFLFGLLLRLIMGGKQEAPVPPLEQLRLVPPAPKPPASWVEVLYSLLFWSLLAGVIVFSIYYYFKQHHELLAALIRLPLLGRLFRLGGSFRDWLRGINRGIARSVSSGLQRLRLRQRGGQGGAGFGYLHLRRLSLRQQIVFFYLAMLRRSGERGWERRSSETPYEYARSLHAHLPEAADEIDGMTEEFLKARYSRREVSPPQVHRVRRLWEQIRKYLQLPRYRSISK